jgi:Zn-dependent peptidase ImmA (M78 family)
MIITALQQLVPRRPLHRTEALAVAEKQAQRLRAALPVDTAAIATGQLRSIPGILVEEVAGLGVSGATRKVADRWIILINADEAPVRRRFTIAHEIKHILDDQAVTHLRQNESGTTAPSWLTERICDYFAACLLMPRPHIKRAYTTVSQDEAALAKMFDVSLDALRIRLQQVGLTDTPQRCDGYTRDVIPLPTRTAAA